MNILYLHPAGNYGGASKSLIELFSKLRQGGVRGTVLTPRGSARGAFARAGMDVVTVKGLSQFDHTRFGHYRRLRWIILLREIYLLPASLWALWSMRASTFDLIHANEITLLPLACVAKRIFRCPLVVHVRSLQHAAGTGLRSRMVAYLLRRHADAVVAIDHTVANSLVPDLPLTVIHNGLQLDAQAGISAPRDATHRPTAAMLGVLARMKGVYEFLEAARILVHERGVDARFLIAGENARAVTGIKAAVLRWLGFSEDVQAELHRRVGDYGLRQHVLMPGFVEDVRTVYPSIDVLCFPSHLDAAGRPVFEAAWYGIPSIVAVRNPVPDAIVDGVTGIAIARPDPVLLADAMQRLLTDAPYRATLGVQARQWAERYFGIAGNAALMLELYQSCLAAQSTRVY